MKTASLPWGHRWVTHKAQEQVSKINRQGLVAVTLIKAGEPVVVYGGVIVPTADITSYRELVGDYDVPFDDDFSIAPVSRQEAISVVSVNHSCDPNLGWKNPIMLIAIRDVRPGEELVVEYAMHGGYAEDMVCACGAPACRGVIRPDDWKNADLRAKYGQWFIPRLKERL